MPYNSKKRKFETTSNIPINSSKKRKTSQHIITKRINYSYEKALKYAELLELNPELTEEEFECMIHTFDDNDEEYFKTEDDLLDLDELLSKSKLDEFINNVQEINVVDFMFNIRQNLLNAQCNLFDYTFDINLTREYNGKIESYKQKINNITFVLTSASKDIKRCNYIKDSIIKNLMSDDHVFVVMAERDYESKTFLKSIGLDDLTSVINRLSIIVIPNGPQTAGYTRSWCVYLASQIDVDDNVLIWIRDDRRNVVPLGSNIKKKKGNGRKKIGIVSSHYDTFKSNLHAHVSHGTVYSPNNSLIWKKNMSRFDNWKETNWTKTNQVICATKKTWVEINKKISYPQGPILEDHAFSFLLHTSGFKCSTMGKFIGIETLRGLESIARPNDTKKQIIKCPYKKKEIIHKAVEMASILLLAIKKYTINGNYINFTISIGDDTIIISNKPDTQGGGQTQCIAILWMLDIMAKSNLTLLDL